jgi:2-oxoglutarate ferredoxin oxidoreductase subunit alpha
MTHLRADKVAAIAKSIPPLEVLGEPEGDLLVLGWGGTYGAICSAVGNLQAEGYSVSSLHLRHLSPFPNDLGEILGRFKKVLVAELNMGQLSMLIRSKYLIDAISYSKIQGQPFRVSELIKRFLEHLH